ncbi:hypothetical protein ACVGWB_17260, partial [Enterobacter mori]
TIFGGLGLFFIRERNCFNSPPGRRYLSVLEKTAWFFGLRAMPPWARAIDRGALSLNNSGEAGKFPRQYR